MKALKPIYNILLIAIFSMALSVAYELPPVLTFSVLFLTGVFIMPQLKKQGMAFMAVTVEIWTKDIVDNLYKDNAWAVRAKNEDANVLRGKVVHIAVAGDPSAVKKNRSTFPASAVKRADSDITYAIDSFTSDPRHIEEIDKAELAYDKRQSAVGEDQSFIIQNAMDSLLYRWAPLVANTLLTTGADAAVTISGGTGTRKVFTKDIFQKMKLKLSKANVLKTNRVAILTEDHYDQFFTSLSDAEKVDFGRVTDLKEGAVGRYMGFDIYTRSTVLRYRGADGAYVVVDELHEDFAASVKTGDRAASLFYQADCVERALGEVKMFDEYGRAEYYGDIFSFLLRMGGRIRRTAGVWAVVEAIGA